MLIAPDCRLDVRNMVYLALCLQHPAKADALSHLAPSCKVAGVIFINLFIFCVYVCMSQIELAYCLFRFFLTSTNSMILGHLMLDAGLIDWKPGG